MEYKAVDKFKDFFGLGGTYPSTPDDHYQAEPEYSSANDYRTYGNTVPAMAPQPSIVPIIVTEFKHAHRIGECFRDNDIVVFTLEGMPRDEARRIVDYSAGLCHGLRGRMKRLQPLQFALLPEGVDVDEYELEDALRR